MIVNKKAVQVNHHYINKNLYKQFTLLVLKESNTKLIEQINELFLLSPLMYVFVDDSNLTQLAELTKCSVFPSLFFFVNGSPSRLNDSGDDIIISLIRSQFRKLVAAHKSNTQPISSFIGNSANQRFVEGDELINVIKSTGAYKSIVYGKTQKGSAIRSGTGKVDIDGRHIYCGDIVLVMEEEGKVSYHAVVSFFNAAFYLMVYSEYNSEPWPILMADVFRKDMKVVSSIFLNNNEDEQFRNKLLKPIS